MERRAFGHQGALSVSSLNVIQQILMILCLMPGDWFSAVNAIHKIVQCMDDHIDGILVIPCLMKDLLYAV